MEAHPSDDNTVGRGNPGKPKKRAPDPPVKQTGDGHSTGAGQDVDVTYKDEEESGDYVALHDVSRDQIGQGAIPKRPLQIEKGREMQASLRSEDTHPGVHFGENIIETAWKQLKFVVSVNSTHYKFDGTSLIDPCQMQLISKSELSRTGLNTRLKRLVCVSIQNPGVVNMIMYCSDTITRNEIVTEVIGDITQALHGTISVTETVENLNHKEGAFLDEVGKKLFIKLSSGEIGVYKSSDLTNVSLIIVGMQENVLQVQNKIKQLCKTMQTFEFSLQKQYDRDTVLSLQSLDFDGHLQQVQPDVEVIPSKTDGTVLKLKGLTEDCVAKAADELEWFISKICTETVKLPLGGIELLRQKDKIALGYVLSRLQEKNIPSYVQISGQSHECAVWCLSNIDANQAKLLIEQCIVSKSMHQSSMESVAMKEFLDLQTGKIICLKYDDEIGQLCLTDDLEAELSKLNLEMESTIYKKKKTITSKAMEMLDALNVRSYINQKHKDVDYSVSSTNESFGIELSGRNKHNVDTAFDDFNALSKKLVKKNVKLSLNCINLLNHGNKKAFTYVQSQLSRDKVTVYLQIGEDNVAIICMDENGAVKSENVLKNCFYTKPVVESYFDFQEGENFLKNNEGCITIVKEEKGAISVCFTADLRKELDALAYLKVSQETVDEMHTIYKQLTKHTVCALQKQDFKTHLTKTHPDVKFGVSDNDPSTVVMSGTSEASLDSAVRVLQLFLKQCVVEEVELHECHVSLLCHPNKKALEFVEHTLEKKKVVVYLVAEEDKVFIFCIDENGAAKSKKIIENCLRENTTSKVYLNTPEAKEFLRCNEGIVLSVSKDKGILKLYYTVDLEEKVQTVINNGSKIYSSRCGPLLEEFLKDYGKHILIEIEKKYQLKISFSDGLCIFNGNSEDGKLAKDEVMQKTAIDVVHLQYSQELMDYLSAAGGQSDIDNITRKLHCYWKMKEPTTPESEENGKIPGVEYIGSWIFGDTNRALSVVEGDYASKGVDLLVYPVNTSMFPVYATEIQTAGGKELMDRCIRLVSTGTRKSCLGDVFIIPNQETGNLKCKMIAFICINDGHFSSQTKKEIDTFMPKSELQACVSKVLLEAKQKGMKSIAFPLPPTKINKMFDPKCFTKAIVNAFLCHFKEYKSSCVEHVLICHKESGSMEAVVAVNRTIVKGFQMTPSSFVRRKMYTDTQDVFQKCTVQTEAKLESIFNLKADCLVVAISPDLDLSKGFVASELLKRTERLQQNLSLKHPNKLKPWELVVLDVKCQSDIMIKKVIFGYIPKWKDVPDAKGVKCFVTECLFAAESHSCKSVVFPALGTGNLGYPQRDIAKAMFDGVEQYRNGTLHGKIKVVNIAVVRSQEDDFVQTAFCDEEKRRQKHAKQKIAIKRPTGFPVVVGNKTNGGQKFPIHLKVMEERFLPSPLSSEYVDVKFRFNLSGLNTRVEKVKCSSSEPFSWTDEIQMECCSKSTLETTMKLVRDECIKQKVSSLVLHCSSGFDLPEADQVEAMVNVICKYPAEYKYLRHVTISTTDNKGYIAAEKKLLSLNPGLMRSMIFSGVVWSPSVEDSRPNMKISIQLVGLSKLDVDKAKHQIETLAHKQVTPAKTERLKNAEGEASAMEEPITEENIFGDVTAEINPEIVIFKKKKDDEFSFWKSQIESYFNTKLHETAGRLMVSGSLESIIRVEEYLDNGFPNLPGETDVDAAVTSNGSKPETTLDVVDDYFEKGQHKFVVPFSEDERESVHFFQEEMDDLTRNVMCFQYKNHAIEISCERRFEKDIGEKIQRLKQRVVSDVQSDEIILETETEIESGAEACKKAEKQLEGSDLLVLRFGNTIKIKALIYDVLNHAKSIILIAIGRRKLTGVGRHQMKIDHDTESKNTQDSRYVGNINGITVFAYRSSIVDVEVEGIVSAANEHLVNTVGVAKLIAKAAGKEEFNNLCEENVRKNGKLQIGECRVTPVGKLEQFKFVFHVYGPENTYNGNPSQTELDQLTIAIIKCLRMADDRGLKSIAIPCISTGTYGFPINISSEQYYRAIVRFSELNPSLLEVHFVDVEETKIESLRSVFSKMMETKHSAVDTLQDSTARRMLDSRCGGEYDEASESTRASSHIESTSQGLESEAIPFHTSLKKNTSTNANMPSGNTLISSPTKVTYNFNIPDTKVKIIIAEGDITEANVDAIVCTESKDFSGRGVIARQIMNMAGELYKSQYKDHQRRKHDLTSVTATKADGWLMCHYVLHAVSPHWTHHYTKHNQDFSRDIRLTVQNILTKASEFKSQSLAIPFLGTSDDEKARPTPVSTCCGAIVEAILHFFTYPTTPSNAENSVLEVQLFSTEHSVIYEWKTEMEKQCKTLQEWHVRKDQHSTNSPKSDPATCTTYVYGAKESCV